jgi:hypothetical protein
LRVSRRTDRRSTPSDNIAANPAIREPDVKRQRRWLFADLI